MKNWITVNKETFFKYIVFIVCIYAVSSIVADSIMVLKGKLEVREVLNFYVRVMQNMLFFSVLISLFSRLNLAIIISLILGYFEVDYAVFANYIAPIVISENSNISPEYPRIIFFLLIIIGYTIKQFIKRKKFIDTFLLLSMLGIMGTSIIFHVVTTSQLNYFTMNQEEQIRKIKNKNDLFTYCELMNLDCNYLYKNNNELVNFYFEKLNIDAYMNNSLNYFRYQIISDYSIQNRIQSRKPIAFITNKDGKFYILDNNNYTKYLKFNELVFGSLSFASHFVWIFGAYYLIWFHTKRRKVLEK